MPFLDSKDKFSVFIMKITIIIELICIPFNVILLIFHCITTSNHIKKNINKKRAIFKIKLDKRVLNLTYLLLIFGLIFCVFQGLIKNILLNDCKQEWLSWVIFGLFVCQRMTILSIFLNRLYTVFHDTIYAYPLWYIILLGILIIFYGILSLILYYFDHEIIHSNEILSVKWKIFNGVCSWKFGRYVTFISRPMEAILSILLLKCFLYKLCKLTQRNKLRSTKQQQIEDVKFRYLFRKLSILTGIAVASNIIVGFGFVSYYTRILGSLFSLDVVINSLCAILMFNWNHFIIKPCVGDACNKCFCLTCVNENTAYVRNYRSNSNISIKSDIIKVKKSISPPINNGYIDPNTNESDNENSIVMTNVISVPIDDEHTNIIKHEHTNDYGTNNK